MLVTRARTGDMRAWTRLYEDHFDALLRYVTYMTGDVAVAEDLVQEVFATAVVRVDTLERAEAFVGWLRGIAANLIRKHWRKRQRRDKAHARLEVLSEQIAGLRESGPERAMVRDRRAEALQVALETLSPRLREAFVLADLHGVSAAEGARQLGISPGNFRVRATRARARLRAEFERHGLVAARAGGRR